MGLERPDLLHPVEADRVHPKHPLRRRVTGPKGNRRRARKHLRKAETRNRTRARQVCLVKRRRLVTLSPAEVERKTQAKRVRLVKRRRLVTRLPGAMRLLAVEIRLPVAAGGKTRARRVWTLRGRQLVTRQRLSCQIRSSRLPAQGRRQAQCLRLFRLLLRRRAPQVRALCRALQAACRVADHRHPLRSAQAPDWIRQRQQGKRRSVAHRLIRCRPSRRVLLTRRERPCTLLLLAAHPRHWLHRLRFRPAMR